jgi:hypothetical protein
MGYIDSISNKYENKKHKKIIREVEINPKRKSKIYHV